MLQLFDFVAIILIVVCVVICIAIGSSASAASKTPDWNPNVSAGVVDIRLPSSLRDVGTGPYKLIGPFGDVVISPAELDIVTIPIDGYQPGGEYQFTIEREGAEAVTVTHLYPISSVLTPIASLIGSPIGSFSATGSPIGSFSATGSPIGSLELTWTVGDAEVKSIDISFVNGDGKEVNETLLADATRFVYPKFLDSNSLNTIVPVSITTVGKNGTSATVTVSVPVTLPALRPPVFGEITVKGRTVTVPYSITIPTDSILGSSDIGVIVSSDTGMSKRSTLISDTIVFENVPTGLRRFSIRADTPYLKGVTVNSPYVSVLGSGQIPTAPYLGAPIYNIDRLVKESSDGMPLTQVSIPYGATKFDPYYSTITSFVIFSDTGEIVRELPETEDAAVAAAATFRLKPGLHTFRAKALSPQGESALSDPVVVWI